MKRKWRYRLATLAVEGAFTALPMSANVVYNK